MDYFAPSKIDLPSLHLNDWRDTKLTLHLFVQIIGKIKLMLMPYKNHWWQVPLYVTSRGLGTGLIPFKNKTLEFNFDFFDHHLLLTTSEGETVKIVLTDGLSVAEYYQQVLDALAGANIQVKILAKPYETESNIPFAKDTIHCSYDKYSVFAFWKMLTFAAPVLMAFSGRFTGKCSPVHLFWHSFDLAVTRFSGRPAPEIPGANKVTKEAYSHEVISAGFWAGDSNITEPAFYSYTYPSPEGLEDEPLLPEGCARWVMQRGSPMAIVTWEDIKNTDDPAASLMAFLESSYLAGARKAGWDTAMFAAHSQYVAAK